MIGLSQPKNQKALATGNDRLIVKYVLSSASAFVAEFVTYPLDLAKTRLQIQGEKGTAANGNGKAGPLGGTTTQAYRGLFRTALGIVQEEGVTKLWYGLPPALIRHAIYTGSRMTMYEKAREKLFDVKAKESIALWWVVAFIDSAFMDGTNMQRAQEGMYIYVGNSAAGRSGEKVKLWQATLLGMSCGALSQFLANPADVVKVMLQMEGRRRLEGKPPRVLGMRHAFRTVVAESGWRGLMRGWAPNMQRAALVNLGDLTAYDTVKHAIMLHTSLKDSPATHAISSLFSGIVAAVFATPADVVKTRMMNQPFDRNGRPLFYQSSLRCLSKTIHDEGLLAVYKGFFPAWIRMGPWSMTFWMVYEQLRRITKPVEVLDPDEK